MKKMGEAYTSLDELLPAARSSGIEPAQSGRFEVSIESEGSFNISVFSSSSRN
jgi:hypothetical protein